MQNSIHNKEYQAIVERLKKARMEVGLTQVDVAQLLGKPQSYISKIELGERRLDVLELKRLIKIYKKPAQYFL